MARTLHVYPKASIEDSTWTLTMKVYEPATQVNSRFVCTGRGGTHPNRHCCMMGRKPCPHLVENRAGRRWACGLMVELGSWDAVEADPRYRPIAAYFDSPTFCRDWHPKPGTCCLEEVSDGRVD